MSQYDSRKTSEFIRDTMAKVGYARVSSVGQSLDVQREKLRGLVKTAHSQGRRIRFWGTPDRPAVWRELHDAGVDLIGTDDLGKLAGFLAEPSR